MANLRRGEQGIGLLLVIIIIAIIGGTTGGGVAAFILLRQEAPLMEQTAKLLPADTQIYFSLNLRPGDGQLTKFRDILERFREHPNFQARVDTLFDEAEKETGINPHEDVLPWIGPEIAVGVIDVVQSAVAASVGGLPSIVAFLGTNDSAASLAVVEDLFAFQYETEDLKIERDTYRGFPVYIVVDADQRIAVTDDYVLFSTDRDLLEATINRIVDGDTPGSLFDSDRFKKARDAVSNPRFSMLYVDTETIWKDAIRLADEEIRRLLRAQLEELIPEWAALTTSFLDKGIKLTALAPITEKQREFPALTNSVAAAELLPADTLALLSFAIEPDLDPLREQLKDVKLNDLGPEASEVLTSQLGLLVAADADLSGLLDAALGLLQSTTGIDFEEDVLDWMAGEFALALLPTNFRAIDTEPPGAALQAAAFIRFDTEKRAQVNDTMNRILDLLKNQLGLKSERISEGGGEGAVFDLEQFIGTNVYQPGYLILDDHLIIATTRDTLKLTASMDKSKSESLARESEYSRLVKEVPGIRNPLIYVSIEDIREAVIAALNPDDLKEYHEEAEPFVEPLRALLLSPETREGLNSFSIILTIE